MARRTFEMIDVIEILQRWHAGRPKTMVAASVGVDPKTVRKYVAPAEAAGLAPGGPALSRAEWSTLVVGWFPELVDAKARSLTFGVIDAHRERIGPMLETNTVTTVHQRLRDEHGLAASIASFRRYVGLEFPGEAAAGKVTVLRPDVAPGEEAQIDYGFLGSWLDPVAQGAAGVGVRDGAGLQPAHVRAASPVDGSARLGRRARRGVRLLRRLPGPVGPRQPAHRG